MGRMAQFVLIFPWSLSFVGGSPMKLRKLAAPIVLAILAVFCVGTAQATVITGSLYQVSEATSSKHHLKAVVIGRIVRTGDHKASVSYERRRCKIEHGSRAKANAPYRDAAFDVSQTVHALTCFLRRPTCRGLR